ncbi:MAG: c-type cytochrome [Verrucomicrobiae bacterium]|nr:c-type cytochrome [Verrucomicrobiae bacterium]
MRFGPVRRFFHGCLGTSLALAVAVVMAADNEARLRTLSTLVRDPSPKVRVEALRALAKIPSAESATLALSVLDQPMDPTLDYALWLTINDLVEPWIQSLQSGAWKPEGRERQLEFALKAIPPAQASRVLGQLVGNRPLPADGSGPWIELIGAAGTPRELRMLWDQTLTGGFNESAAARALAALAEAQRVRKLRPDGDLAGLSRLLEAPADPVRIAALRLSADWKAPEGILPRIAALAGAADTSPGARSAAIAALRSFGGDAAKEALGGLVRAADPSVQREAAAAWMTLDPAAAARAVATLVTSPMPESDAVEFWRGVLAPKGAGKVIAENLSESGIPPAVARAGMRVAREGGRSDLDLVLALARGAGLSADPAAAGGELIRELAAKAAAQGDPSRGETIYRRNDLACLSCHGIGGAGGKVGPDLTSIGASAPPDYLVESLLLPNAKIKEGYHSVVVALRDGSEQTGTLARETPETLVLRNAAGAEVSLPKSDIERREQGTLSLMPGGLLDPLDEQQQLDLIAFLSRLGKPGDFDASKGGVARRWRIGQTVHTDAQSGQEFWPLKASWEDKRWTPTYSLVNGTLPRALVDELTGGQAWTSRLGIYAATEATTSAAGLVRFQLTAGDDAELWVDGRRIGGAGASTAELSAGTHRILVKLDPRRVPEVVRLESPDAAFVLN